MPICCCWHRTLKSRLGSLLLSLPIVVALHVFSFVVKFHASRAFRHCYNFGCLLPDAIRLIAWAVIVVCFVAEFLYLLAFAFPNYVCPVVREEPPIIPATRDEVRAIYRPMAAWYRAPARDALRKHYGEFPPTSEALFAWASFDAVTTAFLEDQPAGVAARI